MFAVHNILDMKFVDRTDEARRLKDALTREKSSLVVMYGRRRLGKSTLVKRVLSENDVYFIADRSEGHIFNDTYYSQTTSHHREAAKREVLANDYKIVGTVDNKPRGYNPNINAPWFNAE